MMITTTAATTAARSRCDSGLRYWLTMDQFYTVWVRIQSKEVKEETTAGNLADHEPWQCWTLYEYHQET